MPQTKKRFYRSWSLWIGLSALLLLGALVRWGRAFDTLTGRYTFLAQSILALFTLTAIVIQARIYWAQRDVMERQWKAMTDQLEAINKQEGHLLAQAEAAKAQAETMRRQLEVTEEALRISQRAYVGVKMQPLIQWGDDGQPIVTLFFVNTGHTPTQKAELTFNFGLGSETFEDFKKEFTIGAHTDKSFDCEWRGQIIDKERRAFIDENEDVLFFEAELLYEDVWGTAQSSGTLRYTYNPKLLGMEEFFAGEIRHKREQEKWNSKIDPNLE